MASYSENLDRLLKIARSILRECGSFAADRQRLRTTGRFPSLEVSCIEEMLASDLFNALPTKKANAVKVAIHRNVRTFREKCLALFATIVRQAVSLEAVGGDADAVIERRIIRMVEARFWRHVDAVRASATTAISQFCVNGEEARKGNGFGPVRLSSSPSAFQSSSALHKLIQLQHATCILETAFAHRPVLTTRETSIVAEKAGITHQQVRLCSLFHHTHTNIQQVRTWVRLSSIPLLIAPPVTVVHTRVTPHPARSRLLRVNCYCPPFFTPPADKKKVSSRGIDPRFRSALACS